MKLTEEQKKINKMFKALVPNFGKASTVAGEIVRALCQIDYSSCKHGDHIGVRDGKEICNPPARYLANRTSSRIERAISDMWGIEDDDLYCERKITLYKEVLAYLKLHPELKTTANTEDMWDFYDIDEDTYR